MVKKREISQFQRDRLGTTNLKIQSKSKTALLKSVQVDSLGSRLKKSLENCQGCRTDQLTFDNF
jgi:hypothetical protein